MKSGLVKYLSFLGCYIINLVYRIIPRKTHIKYDLILIRADAIGDFILWLDCIRAYRVKYQGKKVLLFCPKCDEDIANAIDFFTDVFPFDAKKMIGDLRYHLDYLKRIRYIGADELIMPSRNHQYGADFISAALHVEKKISTAPKIELATYGFWDKVAAHLLDKGLGRRLLSAYNFLIELPQEESMSDFEDNEYFTRIVADDNFRIRLTDLSPIYKHSKPIVNGEYCIISLSSSNILKDWPIDRVSEVLRTVPSKYKIVLTGYGTKDEIKAKYILESDSNSHVILDMVNKTTVIDLICLIYHSSFVLSNDSAAIHIASTCRVPSICYSHGAHFGRYVPYPETLAERQFHPRCVYVKMDCFGCGYRCNKDFNPSKPFYCLRQVSVEMVSKELMSLLTDIN